MFLDPCTHMLKSLGNLLQQRVSRSPVLKGAAAALTVEAGNKVLKELLGEDITEYAQVAYFKDGTLAIGCLSSTVAQEIRLKENEIIDSINKKIGANIVKKLRYLQ